MKAGRKVCVFLILCLSAPIYSDNAEWSMAKNEDGITVENRAIKGFKMKQLMAVTIVDAPIEVIYEVMDTADKYHEWFGDCILQKDIKRISNYEKICYHVVDVPWPLNDRDAVARVTTKADWKGGNVEYRVESIRQPEDSTWGMDEITKKNKRVRMPVMDGVFIFTRITPHKSKFSYTAIADPGIPLPGWILNMFSVTQPFNTLKNLREQVKQPLYWEKASARHNRNFAPSE